MSKTISDINVQFTKIAWR